MEFFLNLPWAVGLIFFGGVCVALYRVGCIRNDVRDIKRLLKKQAGEAEEVKEGGGSWGLVLAVIIVIVATIALILLAPKV